jgi:hypothetical protein
MSWAPNGSAVGYLIGRGVPEHLWFGTYWPPVSFPLGFLNCAGSAQTQRPEHEDMKLTTWWNKQLRPVLVLTSSVLVDLPGRPRNDFSFLNAE